MYYLNFYKKHKLLLLITAIACLYLFYRIIFLIFLPLFNDESIYIRWGQIMIQNPNLAWSSMQYVGKQPPIFWLFGILAKTFSTLKAARFITLALSFPSIFLMYLWLKRFLSKNEALWGSFFVAILPVNILFQSMALMEGVLFTLALAFIYLLTLNRRNYRWYDPFLIGIIISLGLWVKTNMFILFFIYIFSLINQLVSNPKRIPQIIISFIIVTLILVITLLPLILHPHFSFMLNTLSTFSYTTQELLKFPFQSWFNNSFSTSLGLILYTSPIFAFFAIFGFTKTSKKLKIYLLSLLICVSIPSIIVGKVFTFRYVYLILLPLIPLVAIGIESIIKSLKQKQNHTRFFFIGFFLFLGLIFSIYPRIYFSLIPDNSVLAGEKNYVFSPTSGYDLEGVTAYINSQVNPYNYTLIAVSDVQGNPSDFLLAYYYFHPSVKVIIATTTNLSDFSKLKKIIGDYPVTLVTRNSHINKELLPFLTEKKRINNSGGPDYLGIYQVNF